MSNRTMRRQRMAIVRAIRRLAIFATLVLTAYSIVWSFVSSLGETSTTNIATIWALAVGAVSAATAVVTVSMQQPGDRPIEPELQDWYASTRSAESQLRHKLLGSTAEIADIRLTPRFGGLRDIGAHVGAQDLLDLAATYWSLPLRRLVLLGGAGSGKTVAALQLLVNSPTVDSEQTPPLVLRFSLSRWNVDQPLADWLVDQLVELELSRHLAERLVSSGRIVPVLDGLDEMDADHTEASRAAKALTALNNFVCGSSLAPVVITCRTATYARLAPVDRLQDAATLELQAVQPVEAARYIERRVRDPDRWRPVLDDLRSGSVSIVTDALTNPWKLSLALQIYDHPEGAHDPAAMLAAADTTALDDQLINGFFAAAISRGDRFGVLLERRRYGEERCLRTLKVLADYLDYNTRDRRRLGGLDLPTTDITLHELWPLAGNLRVRCADLALSTLMSVPGLLWIAHLATLTDPVARPAFALFYLLCAMALIRTSTRYWIKPTHVSLRYIWSARSLPQVLFAMAVAAVLVAPFGPAGAVAGGLSAWLAAGLAVGLMQGFAHPPRKALDPRDPLRRDRRVSLLAGSAMVPGTALAFQEALGSGPIGPGIGLGAAYALAVGMTVASAPWRRYLVFVVLSRRRLPLRPSAFLAWAYHLGILRRAGVSYQFRHVALQEWLARHPM